jgi:hypothetical protein
MATIVILMFLLGEVECDRITPSFLKLFPLPFVNINIGIQYCLGGL